MNDDTLPAPFALFAQTAQSVGATPKRLEKAALLGAYFVTLTDDSLRLAARYLAGYVFPQRDQRTVNIGGAALLAAILAATGADETDLRRRLVARGDMGDVAEEAFLASSQAPTDYTLTLDAVAALFQTLAATAGTKNKVQTIVSLLARATALEAKYIVKLLQGDLRIGLKEGAVEDAVARAAQVAVGQIQWVNMLLGDIGETAVLARHGRLHEARMALFHPLKFMLATPAADLADVARQMPPIFTVEDKFDGIRAQAHIGPAVPGADAVHGTVTDAVRVALFSRTLDDITPSFPDLVAPLALCPASRLRRRDLGRRNRACRRRASSAVSIAAAAPGTQDPTMPTCSRSHLSRMISCTQAARCSKSRSRSAAPPWKRCRCPHRPRASPPPAPGRMCPRWMPSLMPPARAAMKA